MKSLVLAGAVFAALSVGAEAAFGSFTSLTSEALQPSTSTKIDIKHDSFVDFSAGESVDKRVIAAKKKKKSERNKSTYGGKGRRG